MPPAPCSEDYDNADLLQKMVDELGQTNANLPEINLQNLLKVSPPSSPNRCDSLYLNDLAEDYWWNLPQRSSAQSSESCRLPSRPKWRPSKKSNLLPPRSSDPTIEKRKRTSSKEKQPPLERLTAPRLPNKRYRTSKESSSNKVHSVLAPTLSPPVVSVPLSTSGPVSTTAVNAETPLKLVIKTPVYKTSPSVSDAHCTQNQLTLSNSDSATTYSFLANDLFPFPSDEQIATDIIESIIKTSHYKSSLEALIRKHILLKYKFHIIKINSIDARKHALSFVCNSR